MEGYNGTTFMRDSYEAIVDVVLTTVSVFHQHYNTYVADNESLQLIKKYDTNDDDWINVCNVVYNPELSQNLLEFWMCGIILNIVSILGVLGNAVSIYVLTRPQMRSSGINYLLIILAICDTVLVITSMLLFGIPAIYPYTGYLFFYYNHIYPFISPITFPLAMIAQTSSIYMTFIVTAERYVAVCHPLKARTLCTYGRAKLYFIACLTLSLIYNVPRFFEVLIISHIPSKTSTKLYCVRPTALRRNFIYINVYIHWCYLVINYIVPLLLLSILNCLIYRKVRYANRERQRLSRSEIREIDFATMFICVIVVFLTLNSLALVVNISEAFYNFIDPSLTKISNLMVTINSSCNFIIYMLFGKKFRRTFYQTFFKRCFKSNTLGNILNDSSISNNDEASMFKYNSSRRLLRQNTAQNRTITPNILSSKFTSGIIKTNQLTSIDVPVVYYPKCYGECNT